MDLIDRAAVEKALWDYDTWYSGSVDPLHSVHRWKSFLEDVPTIEAVPLDALCEWLASWDTQVIPCNVCKNVLQLESCPHGPFDCGDSEHLKMLIKKWMEEQNDGSN